MNAQRILLLIATTTCVVPAAFGFAEFARGEVVLRTTARAMYDSRVYGGVSPMDDYIFTLDPRFIYRREAGQIKTEATLGARINRYLDATELDSEDLVTSLRLRLPSEGGSLASGSFLASYDEHTDVNYDVNTRIREKTFLARLNANLPLSLKTAVTLGGSFRNDERNRFSDRETREGSVGFRYVDFLGGTALHLRYRRMEVDSEGNTFGIRLNQSSDIYSATLSRPIYHEVRGYVSYGYRVFQRSRAEVFGRSFDTDGTILSVGIEGPFLPATKFPKLDSSLSLGYQEAETPGINDTAGSRFTGAMHLGWHARERTQIYVDARRALELSVNDLTVETTAASIGIQQRIGNFLSGSASVGYETRDYRTAGREDDAVIVQTSAHYQINRAWSASAEYRLRSTDSTFGTADYARHLASVWATYTF